jgi:holo-[acyl-carrier protein] synthase
MGVRGVGFDLVSIPEFTEQLARPGTRILQSFTPGERRDCASRSDNSARHYAARWAAKEAVFKAWSVSRFARPKLMSTMKYDEIEVVTDAVGRPSIRVTGQIAEYIGEATIHVSLTHDGDMAGAFVVIEAE